MLSTTKNTQDITANKVNGLCLPEYISETPKTIRTNSTAETMPKAIFEIILCLTIEHVLFSTERYSTRQQDALPVLVLGKVVVQGDWLAAPRHQGGVVHCQYQAGVGGQIGVNLGE
jgi:hypothetical protein